MVIQFLTKCTDEKLLSTANNFFQEELIINHLNQKTYGTCIIKAILLGISQNYDSKVKNILEEFILNLIQNDYLFPYFNEDMEKILLQYALNEESVEKRKKII